MDNMITAAEAAGQRTYKTTMQLLDDDNQIVDEIVKDVYTRMTPDDYLGRWQPYIFNAAIRHFKPEIGFAVRIVCVEETTEWVVGT